MNFQSLTTFEQYLEEPGGATRGWLARYGSGQALWCGELSRTDFKLQSGAVRAALRDDLGWFLVDYDLTSGEKPFSRVLGKVACESIGLELMQLIIQSRLCTSPDRRNPHPMDFDIPLASKCIIGGLSTIGLQSAIRITNDGSSGI